VYIPKKLDRRGRRFGFVKFKEVQEVEVLSERLKDVWIGSFKLWVNRYRFARSDGFEAHSQNPETNQPERKIEEAVPGRSFRSALMGESSASSQVLKVPVNEDLCRELQSIVVVTLASETDVRRIQATLFMEGYQSISVTPMGGNMAILRSPVVGDVERLVKSKNECLSYYFSAIKPWNPGLMATQREVWVQIYGIPLHIWGENLFKLVGKRLGVFLDFDEETASITRFDVARIKILTATWPFIDMELKVEVDGVRT
jgi:hypothetical protein